MCARVKHELWLNGRRGSSRMKKRSTLIKYNDVLISPSDLILRYFTLTWRIRLKHSNAYFLVRKCIWNICFSRGKIHQGSLSYKWMKPFRTFWTHIKQKPCIPGSDASFCLTGPTVHHRQRSKTLLRQMSHKFILSHKMNKWPKICFWHEFNQAVYTLHRAVADTST